MSTTVLERVSSITAFEGLREEWTELLRDSPADCLFLTWEWCFAWWRHLAGARRLSLLTVHRQGRLIALAPLAVRPRSLRRLLPWPGLELLGTGIAGSDYLDLIVRRGHEREALAALADALVADNLVLELTQLPRAGSAAAELAARLGQRDWATSESPVNVCPFIALSGHSWASYLASLGSAHRYNFQRRLRNLTKQFDVCFEQVGCEAERRAALEVLVELHNRRWDQRGGSESFATGELRAFYDTVSRFGLERGWLRLFVLRLDGRPVAALHGYRYGATFSFYQAGFDPAFARHSVGLVTMGLAIKAAIEDGAGEYDLLHGAEPYKFQWANRSRDLGRIELFPSSAHGRLCRRVLTASRSARRAARRLLGDTMADRLVRAASGG